MILHDFPTANIVNGNTLSNPKFKDGENLRTYDYVVANPPFSDKTWSTGLTPSKDAYQRFTWGAPPDKQGDYAYLLHIVRSMKSSGKAACILPHGVLFRGNAEGVIRQKLIESGYLKGIIGLPANLFYGTGIPACVLVLDKENAKARKGIFMIDASKGFIKDGNKNRLREQDIHKIVDTFNKQLTLPRFSRMVPFEEISSEKNDFNLNLPRYIDSTEPEDLQDIDGHLRGGIPERDLDALQWYWEVMPGLRTELFKKAGRAGYSQLRIAINEVKSKILNNDEFSAFEDTVRKLFKKWVSTTVPYLQEFDRDKLPKELIELISEDLLTRFRKAPLLDTYDMYQHLMNYWSEAMQDDCYLIAADGWVAETYRVMEEVKAGRNKGEMKDKGWACDLIPKQYIVNRFFAKEQEALEKVQAELETIVAGIAELEEENSGEDGAFSALDKINKAEVNKRLKEIKGNPSDKEEFKILQQWVNLDEQKAVLSRNIREAEDTIDLLAYEQYPKLSVEEIKSIVIDDKWLKALTDAVQGEIERVSQTLTTRIRELAERYEKTLPKIIENVEELTARVEDHLRKMGAVWK
jgi:type I restriction enzyme M protein